MHRRMLKEVVLLAAYIISFFLYYSGLLTIFTFFRRSIFRKKRILVLGYHSIGLANPHYATQGEYMLSREEFSRQLRYLKNNYNVVPLSDLVACLQDGRCAGDCVAITFDDGYKDAILQAVPILKEYQMPAAFFIVSGLIGKKEYLDWGDIETMQRDGFIFGSHTVSHPRLTQLDSGKVLQEMRDSKMQLERELKQKVQYFAYPYGLYNQDIMMAAQEAGFTHAFTTVDRSCNIPSLNRFALSRKTILRRPFWFFAVKIEGLFEGGAFSGVRRWF